MPTGPIFGSNFGAGAAFLRWLRVDRTSPITLLVFWAAGTLGVVMALTCSPLLAASARLLCSAAGSFARASSSAPLSSVVPTISGSTTTLLARVASPGEDACSAGGNLATPILRFMQPRALGRRVSDEFAVPLCRTHHRALHRSGDEGAWWKVSGIDAVMIAQRLWQHTRLNGAPIQ
jgi:hypothetical protein